MKIVNKCQLYRLVINTANLLSTAASQLKLTPPNLGSLVPVSSAGDSNNNVKNNIPPPPSVISFVVDVGNNNNNNSVTASNLDDSYIGMCCIVSPTERLRRE